MGYYLCSFPYLTTKDFLTALVQEDGQSVKGLRHLKRTTLTYKQKDGEIFVDGNIRAELKPDNRQRKAITETSLFSR